MNIDPDGHKWWHWVLGALLIIATAIFAFVTAGAAAVVANAAIAGVEGVLSSATIGLASISSFATVLAISTVTTATIGFVLGGISYDNGNVEWNWENASQGFMWSALSGFAAGIVAPAGSFMSAISNVGINALVQHATTGKVNWSSAIFSGIASIILGLAAPLKSLGGIDLSTIQDKLIALLFGVWGGIAEHIALKLGNI